MALVSQNLLLKPGYGNNMSQLGKEHKKLRLLFVNKVSPLSGGGAELRLKELAARLSEKGHYVEIICGQTSPNEPKKLEISNCEVIVIRTLPAILFRIRYSFYISRLLFYFISIPLIWRSLRNKNWDYVIDDYSPLPSGALFLSKIYFQIGIFFVNQFLENFRLSTSNLN